MSADELWVTINSERMKLSHGAQASVVCTLPIPNGLLYHWYKEACTPQGSISYVGLLNAKVNIGVVKLAGKLAKAKGRMTAPTQLHHLYYRRGDRLVPGNQKRGRREHSMRVSQSRGFTQQGGYRKAFGIYFPLPAQVGPTRGGSTRMYLQGMPEENTMPSLSRHKMLYGLLAPLASFPNTSKSGKLDQDHQ